MNWLSRLYGQMKEIVLFTRPAIGLWLCGPFMGLIDTAVVGQGSSIELAALGPATVFLRLFGLLFHVFVDSYLSITSHSPTRRSSRRLPTSLIALQLPRSSSFSPSPGHSKMRLPVMKFCGKIMYSRTFNDVEKAVTKFLKVIEEKKREMMQIAIGFDIEWKPTFRKGVPAGKVAVMQICCDTSQCLVLHLIHSGIPQNLQLLLQDSTVLKVGAGIGGDATKISRDYDISIKGCYRQE